jgi:hypothetical protein
MKTSIYRNLLPALLLISLLTIHIRAANPPASDIPYSLGLSAFTIDGLPGIHSAVYAGDEHELVILAGRTNGMHGFPSVRTTGSAPSFPPDARNHYVYVVDLTKKKVLGSASVDGLPLKIANQLTASNTQFALANGWLYIVGGYGLYGAVNSDPGLTPIYTFPTVLAIDFKALVSAVKGKKPLDTAFAAANIGVFDDPNLQITGGALKFFNGRMLLILGHSMNGLYTTGGGTMTQTYSSSVRVWEVSAVHDGAVVQLGAKMDAMVPNNPYGVDPSKDPLHRRDLPVEGAINAQGNERIVAYGGVFVAGKFDGFVNPVYIDAAAAPAFVTVAADNTTTQLLSQYECAVIPAYSAKSKAMYSTFFGGISEYYWKDGALHHDPPNLNITPPVDGLPFIDSISTLKNNYSGSTPVSGQYLHVQQTFPPAPAQAPQCGGKPAQYLGAETRFIRVAGVPHYDNEVIQLDHIGHKTVIGYLVGGMTADAMYAPPNSCASNMIYAVTLDPSQATVTKLLVAP